MTSFRPRRALPLLTLVSSLDVDCLQQYALQRGARRRKNWCGIHENGSVNMICQFLFATAIFTSNQLVNFLFSAFTLTDRCSQHIETYTLAIHLLPEGYFWRCRDETKSQYLNARSLNLVFAALLAAVSKRDYMIPLQTRYYIVYSFRYKPRTTVKFDLNLHFPRIEKCHLVSLQTLRELGNETVANSSQFINL